MKEAARRLDFEQAAELRDRVGRSASRRLYRSDMTLEEKLERLPDRPGVYLYKDAKAAGRSTSARRRPCESRVRSYFQESRPHDPKTDALVRQIRDLEYIVTDNELEALMLEANLVRKHRPRYNIILRDDKHYPFLKLTTDEAFPRLVVARRVASDDGATYYGPFYPATAMRETLRLTRQLFPLRTCSIRSTAGSSGRASSTTSTAATRPARAGRRARATPGRCGDVQRFLEGKDEELATDADRRRWRTPPPS